MEPREFLDIAVKTAPAVKKAIESGAQWELYFHVELVNALRTATGRIPSREMPYAPFVGSKMGNEACDLVIQDGSQYIFVECKVESAHNQLKFSNLSAKKVTELEEGCNNDVWKLAQLKPEQFKFVGGDGTSAVTSEPARISKWILIVAWSIKGKAKVLSASAPNIFTDITTYLVFWVATVD